MKKAILVSMIAVMTLLTLSFVSASIGELTSDWEVTVDGMSVDSNTISGIEAGQTIPIEVVFKPLDCAEDVKVKAEIDYEEGIVDVTPKFELVEGSKYTKRLSLELPEDIDPTEELTLEITISNQKDKDSQEYTILLQRESYRLSVLDAEMPSEAEAGSVIAVDVVLKNWGMQNLEDVFAKVAIPELGIQRKVYFGDIDPLDECEYRDDVCTENNSEDCRNYFKDCNGEDSAQGRLYITIPENAKSGVYDVEIQAYNVDSTQTIKKSIAISGEQETTNVLTGTSSKTLDIGQEVTYDLVIVNSGSSMKVYTLTPEQINGLTVNVDPVVTVPADSSKTIQVTVKATESAQEGTHLIKINVESEGQLIQQTSLSANVEKGTASTTVTNSVVVLTIVLVIIFVVLLIILIVLLTKKPSTVETEETSYY
jgi:hypothetical protein